MEYAVLTLDFEVYAAIRKWRDFAGFVKRRDAGLYRIVFHYNPGVAYYPNWRDLGQAVTPALDAALAEVELTLQEAGWAALPDGYEIPYPATTADCHGVQVDESSVLFSAYHKHAERPTEVETRVLTMSDLQHFMEMLSVE